MTKTESEAIFGAKKTTPVDKRPFWKRLLASMRIHIKPGKCIDKPVSYVEIKAKADF